MPFRISDLSIFDSAVRNVQRNRSVLQDLQSQVGSGRRIISPSDDPSGAAQVLGLRRATERIEQFQRNIGSARNVLESTESALASASNLMIRARELAVSADVETPEFDQIQNEVEELYDELLQVANNRSGAGYLFAGFRTDVAPFTRSGPWDPAAPSPTVSYGGDTGEIVAQVGEVSFVTRNLTGAEVFTDDADQDGTPEAGRVDLFAVLGGLRDALRTQDPTAVLTSIGELDTAIDQVSSARGTVGARLNRLDITEVQLRDLDLAFERERAGLEDVDYAEAVSELSNRETIFQASLAVTTRVLQRTLADFLR